MRNLSMYVLLTKLSCHSKTQDKRYFRYS